jgi:hypothetical protein
VLATRADHSRFQKKSSEIEQTKNKANEGSVRRHRQQGGISGIAWLAKGRFALRAVIKELALPNKGTFASRL